MTGSNIHICNILKEDWSNDNIPDLIDYCVQIGCKTTHSDDESGIHYSTADMVESKLETDLDTAKNELMEAGKASVHLWYEELDLSLQINLDGDYVPDSPHVCLSIDPVYFETGEIHTPSGVKHRTEEYVEDNINDVIHLTKEFYSFGSIYSYGDTLDRAEKPEGVCEGVVDKIYWLNIFSPKMADNIGRDRLLTAPAWKVEQLPDESVLLVVSDNPVYSSEYSEEEVMDYLDIR